MALAFGHLISAWILGKVYEKASSKKLGQNVWFFLLFGGILPDIDFLVEWGLKIPYHRTFTHSIMFLVLMVLAVYIISVLYKEKYAKRYAIAIGAGILVHLVLDMSSTNGIMFFWPNEMYFSFTKGATLFVRDALFANSTDVLKNMLKRAIFDMGLGIAWIFSMWQFKKLRF